MKRLTQGANITSADLLHQLFGVLFVHVGFVAYDTVNNTTYLP